MQTSIKRNIKQINAIYIVITFIILNLFLASCDSNLWDQRLTQGEIEFNVTYPEMDEGNVLVDFMPDVMDMKFKDDKVITELSAGMGMFKTTFIADCKTHTMNQMVKLVNKKYSSNYDLNNIGKLNAGYDDFYIINSGGMKEIAGYHCKEALVVFNTVDHSSFYIYYTDDIKIADPNWIFPFNEIKGVPLQYRIERNGIVMELIANTVTEVDIPEEAFISSNEFTEITHEKMEKELNDIFESFNY